jgi:fumarate reductase flavoprotein subunit
VTRTTERAAALSVDVAVIGGGLAGLVAANRAAEAGLAVAVFEKGADERYLCNTRLTGGFFHIALNDINSSPDQLRQIIQRATRGAARTDLADALAEDAGRALAWLKAQGMRFIKVGPHGYQSTVFAPPGLRQTGLHWQGRGGDVVLRILGPLLSGKNKGRLVRGTRATGLVMENGRCIGVTVEGTVDGFVHAGAVVIADGGFQADMNRLRQHVSPRPEKLRQRNAMTGTGDGARMAEAVGAKLTGLGAFYGHVQHRDALTNDALWPYPVLDMVAASGIVVNGGGVRFCDEGEGGIAIANAIARLPDPASSIAIFDEAIWDGPGREFLLPANPNLVKAGGEIVESGDIASLGAKLSLPAGVLEQTVTAYNAACASGTLASLTPTRTASPIKPWPIVAPPFRAARLCAGITYTMGGIATDARARVLDGNDDPIPGLYAAGSATGGLEGGAHAAYTGGLSKTLVFALRAGETIAEQFGRKLG